MIRFNIRACLVAAAAVLFAAGCQTTESGFKTADYAPDPGLLRVGVSPNSRPIIFKQGDAIVGLDADLGRMLGEAMGRTTVFVEMPFDRLIDALDRDEIDLILSNMSVTSARQTRVAFTAPYMPSGQMALIRRVDSRSTFKSGSDVMVTDKLVGVEEATTGQYFVQSVFQNAKIRKFGKPEAAAEALVDNKIDVFVHDAPVIWRLAGDFESRGLMPLNQLLTREFVAGAVALDNPELLAEINAVLSQWTEDGTIVRVTRRWAPYL